MTAMKYVRCVFCTALLLLAAGAQAAPAVVRATVTTAVAAPATLPVLRLEPRTSRLLFEAKQLGVPMAGNFSRYSVDIRMDPRQPQSGHVAVRIDLASVRLNEEADSLLLEADWFDATHFPTAQFVSKQIRQVSQGELLVDGTFTLKGKTLPLTVPVRLVRDGQAWRATGRFVVPRLAYQIGRGDWADTSVIANDVTVNFVWQLQADSGKK